jgi:hypothetical protein
MTQTLVSNGFDLAEICRIWQLLHRVLPHSLNARHLLMYQSLAWLEGQDPTAEATGPVEAYAEERACLLSFFQRAIAQIHSREPCFREVSQHVSQHALVQHPQWHELLMRLAAYGLIDLLEVPLPDARTVACFYTRWAIEDGDGHYQAIHASSPYFLLERIFGQEAFFLLHLIPEIFPLMQAQMVPAHCLHA